MLRTQTIPHSHYYCKKYIYQSDCIRELVPAITNKHCHKTFWRKKEPQRTENETKKYTFLFAYILQKHSFCYKDHALPGALVVGSNSIWICYPQGRCRCTASCADGHAHRPTACSPSAPGSRQSRGNETLYHLPMGIGILP